MYNAYHLTQAASFSRVLTFPLAITQVTANLLLLLFHATISVPQSTFSVIFI